MLAYYPLTAVMAAFCVFIFVLIYQGGGAIALLAQAAPVSQTSQNEPEQQNGDGEPVNQSGAEPSPDAAAGTPAPTSSPPPAGATASATGRLIPYPERNLYGYKNLSGQVVIAPQFLVAEEFHESAYAFAAVEQGGELKYGMLKRDGTWHREPRFDNVRVFSEGLAAVEMDDKWGYINETGELVIPCTYREVRDFHGGRAAVRPASTFGYIDPDGGIAIEPYYDVAGDFYNDMAFVSREGKRYIVNKVGTSVATLREEDGSSYSEGFAVMHSERDRYYFIDEKRATAFSSKRFDDARNFKGGYAAIKIGSYWGFINRVGTESVTTRFTAVGDFSQELAAVRDEKGLWGYVDKAGKLKISHEYDEAGAFLLDGAIVKKGSSVGVINKEGTFTELYTE